MAIDYVSVASLLLVVWCIERIVASVFRTSESHGAPHPPGPKPKPLIGNALDFPTSNAQEVYIEWGMKYNSKSDKTFRRLYATISCNFSGGFVYASAMGNKILILNKFKDADELFEHRARKYSDRPEIPVTRL